MLMYKPLRKGEQDLFIKAGHTTDSDKMLVPKEGIEEN